MLGPTLLFRTIIFVLALGYWFYQFTQIENANDIGWQFRFLTIWTLTANLIVAWQMLRISLGKTTNQIPHFVSLVVVMNISVVVNYWRIYFDDPANFYRDGNTRNLWQEYYLHLLGPILMWIDAFLIHRRVFERLKPVFVYALILGMIYPLWIELVVAPLNDTPTGTVTHGLPYGFLNDMEIGRRLIFYSAITVGNFIFILLGWTLARGLARAGVTRN